MPHRLLAAMLPLFLVGSAVAADSGAECDRLAGSIWDTLRPKEIVGVEFEAIEAGAAIPACEAARAAAPGEVRYTFQLGRSYYAAKRYGEAITLLRQATDANYAAAANTLAQAYQYGEGLAASDSEAVKYYRIGAAGGNAPAETSLAAMIAEGRGGTQQDFAEAVALYRQAAAQNLPEAERDLGVMYQNGRGVAKDETLAREWFRKSAEHGLDTGQTNYGLALATGLGGPQDDEAAVIWFRKAAEQGFPPGETSLGVMLSLGRGTRQDNVAAATWLRKAAEEGEVSGAFNLGVMYKEGRIVGGTPVEMREEALKWLRIAADKGHEGAKKALREMGESVL
jgi:TPR repeat protein